MPPKKWRKKVKAIASLLAAIAAAISSVALALFALARLLGRGG